MKARTAKAAAKPYKLPDAGGLHLFVTKTGSRSWHWRYEIGGKEKLLTLGHYPELGLAAVREARNEARKLLRAGRDPGTEKRLRRAAAITAAGNTFEAMARDWHKCQLGRWTKQHGEDVIRSLENDVLPLLGPLPVTEITAPIVVKVLRAIGARPAIETAHRVRQWMSAVFVHAVALGIGQGDPAAFVKGAMTPVPAKTRQPAITDLDQLRPPRQSHTDRRYRKAPNTSRTRPHRLLAPRPRSDKSRPRVQRSTRAPSPRRAR